MKTKKDYTNQTQNKNYNPGTEISATLSLLFHKALRVLSVLEQQNLNQYVLNQLDLLSVPYSRSKSKTETDKCNNLIICTTN